MEGKLQSRRHGLAPSLVSKVIDTVSYTLRVDDSGSAAYVEIPSAVLSLSPSGVSFTPPQTRIEREQISFQTAAVKQGRRLLASAGTRQCEWSVQGNTMQVLRDGQSGLVEHYQARRHGVEVTWILPHRPTGEGELTIEAQISGAEFASRSATGLHFSSPDLASRLTVGPVFAVDSIGRSWPVSVEAAGSALRINVPQAIISEAAYPLAIDPLISPEFGFDAPIDARSPSTRAVPAVAAGESGYLAVWVQGAGEAVEPGIYAARLDATGQLLDPYGVLISSIAGEQSVCAVASIGGQFLVAWSGPRGSSSSDWDIYGARVMADGTLLDSQPLAVCSVAGVQCSPALAANGTNYLVVWRDSRQTGVYGNVVTVDGVIAVTNGFPICGAVNDQYAPSVAASAGQYLVVWQDYRSATTSRFYSDIYGARVTSSGEVIDTNGIAICVATNSQYQPCVAGGETGYFVTWEDYDLGGNDILGVRVGLNGSVMDPTPITVSHGPNLQSDSAAVWSGPGTGQYIVVWEDFRLSPTNRFEATLRAAMVQSDGSMTPEDGFPLGPLDGPRCHPSLANRSGEFMAVWQDAHQNPDTTLAGIYGARVTGGLNPVVQPEALISTISNAELGPSVAGSAAGYLVVWTDNRNADTTGLDIYGVRVSADGVLLDTAAVPICTATNRQSDPAVASTGSSYCVVWSDWRNTPGNASHADIYGSFVPLVGDPSAAFPVCTATNDQRLPAIANSGTDLLVVWQDGRNGLPTAVRLDVYGAWVSDAGEVPISIPICTNSGNQITPAVAANNQQALVAWTDSRAGTSSADIYATRVNSQEVLDTNNLALCVSPGQQIHPTVSTDGEGFLVAWSDLREAATTGTDIYGILVDSTGVAAPTNGFAIRVASGVQSSPTVGFNGLDYEIAWQESEAGNTNHYEIHGCAITPNGQVQPSAGLALNAGAANYIAPALSVSGNDSTLLVSQTLKYSAPRLVANVINFQALPEIDTVTVANGNLMLQLRSSAGERYMLEASSDLKTWSPITTFTSTNSVMRLTDPVDSNAFARFYRVTLLP
jgi:hypothetical protein